MKNTKMFCSIDHIWKLKWTELKAKIIIWDGIEFIKLLYFLTMIKSTFLKVDMVVYHIS